MCMDALRLRNGPDKHAVSIRHMKSKTLVLALVGVSLVVAATSVAFDMQPAQWLNRTLGKSTKNASTEVAQANLVESIPPLVAGSTPNFRAIVQQATPAVVGVTAAGLHQSSDTDFSLDFNDPFFQFFRGLPGFQLRIPRQGSTPFRSQGSGFIVSPDGIILTNAHVVRDAKEVVVRLSDYREFKARVLGSDAVTDIAVLRIPGKEFPVVRLGDDRQLQVGDPVLAIGSPFGFEQSATQGIVSAKGRSLPGETVVPFIQTDVAVNPGNSGGPLFDGSGAVVGINAQIYSQSGGFQGLSFAIPISVAMKIKEQIVSTGNASHARLGVVVQDLTQALANSFNLSKPEGALIAHVASGSSADVAGLKVGDVVTRMDGQPVARSGDLRSRISMSSPGDTVLLAVWRDHSFKEVKAKLGVAQKVSQSEDKVEPNASPASLGLTVRPLTPTELAANQVREGLLVERVSGASARAGVLPGDVLLTVNGVPLKSIGPLTAMLAKKPASVALLILRGGERVFVPIELG
jgi:serine protease Do